VSLTFLRFTKRWKMSFNKNTWGKDYLQAPGLKKLAETEGRKKYGSSYKPPKKKKGETK
jgi:hypothetical protein